MAAELGAAPVEFEDVEGGREEGSTITVDGGDEDMMVRWNLVGMDVASCPFEGRIRTAEMKVSEVYGVVKRGSTDQLELMSYLTLMVRVQMMREMACRSSK